MHHKLVFILLISLPCSFWLNAQTEQASPLLKAMQTELDRSMDLFKSQELPPYFISYTITEQKRTSIEASYGLLEMSSENHERQLALDVRVGDYSFDNSHEIRGEYAVFRNPYTNILVPIEDDFDAIRTIIWLETDKKYKKAVEDYTKVKTNKAVKVKEEDVSNDFSKEMPERHIDSITVINVDRKLWESKLKKYTEPFKAHPDIFGANASFEALVESKYFVNSEGTVLQTSIPYVRLLIHGFSKADDGMELPRYESFFAFTPEGLPSDEEILQKVDLMIKDMENLRVAPLVDPYTGPALLSGGTTGVFFHEVFGHRVEGHRQKSEEEGQTFKKMIGEKILPATIDVIYDPTLNRIGKTDLSGYYLFDDEGTKAQRVTVVDKGVFKKFLMGRSPIDEFPNSNGHGRCQAGYQPVSRQSNLIIQTTEPLPVSQLRQMLIDDCKKQNKPYGLFISQIEGGFTMTGRMMPNSFNVSPLVVYRIYTDGRPDELVRGVDLVGTPLTVFSKVVAAGNDPETWYGFCGAESGGVPVSQTCPSLLVSQIEVQKKAKSQAKPPVLPAPADRNP